ncbi:MAG: 3-methyl-2-oxobutanoate hydroxymethyltransferase [Actinobacteria bacterium]|nr:3-methyl-2-oxobutanoate hydroxymethyltransferase [Actinomycetota bacterium]
MPKLNIQGLHDMKLKGETAVWVTAYDYPTAQCAEAAGVDMILVGDSLGMCVYGYESTIPVSMEQCLMHCEAVRRAAPNTFLVGDMPFLSYQVSIPDAVLNSGRFFKTAAVDAIKLEGGRRVVPQVRAITDAGMVVFGHIGLTPQSSGQLGGFKAQGRTAGAAYALIEDAVALEEAGILALLVEAVPPEVCGQIRSTLSIPVYSIGAGADADGQLMIGSDVLGVFQAFTPKFVKRFADISGTATGAFKAYGEEVRRGVFPTADHAYTMVAGEEEKFLALLKREREGR